MQRKHIRKSLDLILTLLNLKKDEKITPEDRIWIEKNPEIIKKIILIQGVGPYLFCKGNESALANTELYISLGRLYENNHIRIQRMHDELHGVLHQANQLGIQVMPLKGSLLTTCFYPIPGIRPMADIDLLIKPQDFSGLRSILEGSGYQLVESETSYANHHTFIKPENMQVIAWDTEHPDNPRPIEVHTELRRPILGSSGEIDLTELIWQDSYTIDIFGRKAISPTLESLFIYLAIHAASHFFIQTGRILYWLDLALLSDKIRSIKPIDPPERIYLPLKLASRAFPDKFSLDNFGSLEKIVDWRIRKWSSHVPLDERCGLMTLMKGPQDNQFLQRVNRWNPTPWRLIFNFGSLPLAKAYKKYIQTLLSRSHQKMRE